MVSAPLISCSQIGLAPVANFTANSTGIVADSSVNFTDISTNSPTSWSWTFQGGSPSSSTVQNPSDITYSTAGCYDVKLVATNTFGSDSLTETCYIDVNPVGMDEMQITDSRLQVYPNPSNGQFQVSCMSTMTHVDRIEIYNMYGQKVYETSNFNQQTSNEIDLSESPKGIYCVNFYDGKKNHTQKIVIR